MQKKYILVFLLSFCFFLENGFSKMMPQAPTSTFQHQPKTKSSKKSKRLLKKLSKHIKKQNPKSNDDLWVLQLIFLVALAGIITFTLSAIMLALNGLSSLWITLMIIGGVIGILPMLLVGAALLFNFL